MHLEVEIDTVDLQEIYRNMKLAPREIDHLVLSNAGQLSQKRLAR